MFVLRRSSLLICSVCSSGHDAELAVLMICFGVSSMRQMSCCRSSCIVDIFRFKFNEIYGIKKCCLKTYMRQNDLDRYLCTICSLQHLASTWVYPGFSMGSMLLIFLVFRIVYIFYILLLLAQCIYLENIFFTLFYSIIISIYSYD